MIPAADSKRRNMALLAAEKELQKLGLGLGAAQLTTAGAAARC